MCFRAIIAVMLEKFLFYFVRLLCSGAIFFLTTACHRRSSHSATGNDLGTVKWMAAVEGQSSNARQHSLRTLTRDGIFRPVRGEPTLSLAKTFKWHQPKIAEITLGGGVSAIEYVNQIRDAFQSSDALLVDALADLLVNGREYLEKKVPWNMVGVRALGPEKLRFYVRRKSPELLRLILTHPATWPEAKRAPLALSFSSSGRDRFERNSLSMNRVLLGELDLVKNREAFARAQAVLLGEADFADDLPPALLPQLRGDALYAEADTPWQLMLLASPYRASDRLTLRRELIRSVNPSQMSRFFTQPFLPAAGLLDETKTGTWFPEISKPMSPLPGETIRLMTYSPLSNPAAYRALTELAEQLTAQWGAKEISVTHTHIENRPWESTYLQTADIVALAMPILPFYSQTWSDLLWSLAPPLHNDEYQKLMTRWSLSREDRGLVKSLEDLLMEKERILLPLCRLRESFLRSPRLASIRLSSYGYWDWTDVALGL